MDTPFQKAVKLLGGQTKTAELLTEYHRSRGETDRRIYQSHIGKWLNATKNGIPAEYCRAIEQATGGAVTRYDLRPDVFGISAESECNPIKEAA